MGSLARRLDDEAAEIEVGGNSPAAIRFSSRLAMRDWKSAKIFIDPDLSDASQRRWAIASARLYRKSEAPSKRRACSAIANRSVMPAI